MIQLHQLRNDNSLGNFSYVLKFEDQTWVIDPNNHKVLMDFLGGDIYSITGVINTHGHTDHIFGNKTLKKYRPNLMVLRQSDFVCGEFLFEDLNDKGEQVGWVRIYHTPGHRKDHISLHVKNGDEEGIIVGDTIFHGAVGNCKDGNVVELYESIEYLKKVCSPDCKIWCAHDYLLNNLAFLQYLGEDNDLIESIKAKKVAADNAFLPTTFAEQMTYNPFLRLDEHVQEMVAKHSREKIQDQKHLFTILRHMRDHWKH